MKRTLEMVAIWSAGLGAAGFLAGYFLPMLRPYAHWFAIAVVGGVVVWVIFRVV